MKQMTRRIAALVTAVGAVMILGGCWTPPTHLPATTGSPDQNWLVMETGKGTAVMSLTNESLAAEGADAKAKVILIDRSYRLVTVMFGDGHTQTFKVALPDTLDHVKRGDNAIVRTVAPTTKEA
jgi:hypothetical protein